MNRLTHAALTATSSLCLCLPASAQLAGFQPTPSYSQLSVTTSASARVALPTGTTIVVYNKGVSPAFVLLGGSSVSATISDDMIPANSAQAFTVGPNTYIAAISTGGSTSLNISGGSGLPTGWGGGGSRVPTGSAGSPNASVVTVQGISGGATIPVTGTLSWPGTASASSYGTAPSGTVPGVNAAVTNTISDNLAQIDGTALGAPTNWGTAPSTSVVVPNVNVNMVGCASSICNTNGQQTMANSSPVAIASNQSPVAIGVNTANATTAPHICGSHAYAHVTASGNTQIIALSSGHNIYICDYSVSNQATAVNAYLESATASACGGTLTQIDMIWSMTANGGMKGNKPYYTGLNTGSGNALCVNASTTAAFDVAVDYDQY
jgi:hypothetical protein